MATNSGRRLDRLLPALSARERALVVLRHQKAGTRPPPNIMSTLPQAQQPEFHRLVGLMNAANCELSYALFIINEQVTQLALKYGWLLSLVMSFDETMCFGHAVLGRLEDAKAKRAVRKLLDLMPGEFERPVDVTSLERGPRENHLDWIARGLVTAVREALPQRWCELRSIDIAIEEIAEEFDGEDPLRPDTRAILDGAKARCIQLRDDIQPYVEPFELPEPSDGEMELVRRLIAAAGKG